MKEFKTCINGCNTPCKAKGLCKLCYARMKNEERRIKLGVQKRYKRADGGTCSNGCDKPIHFMGLCDKCYRTRKYLQQKKAAVILIPPETQFEITNDGQMQVTIDSAKLIRESGIRPGECEKYLDTLQENGLIQSYMKCSKSGVLTIILDSFVEIFLNNSNGPDIG